MIRTIVFFAYFWTTLVLTTPICFVYLILKLARLGPFFAKPMRFVISTWAKTILGIAGIKVDARGLENIPDGGNVCFMANHQGNLDTLAMLALLPRVSGFIAKSEGRFVPIMNIWLFALGSVFIDRTNVRNARASIERGVKNLKSGNPMIIFPEGTRSRSRTMGPFRNGSFKLPTLAGAAIVPITIDGAWHCYEEKKRVLPGRVSFIVHDTVLTAGMTPDDKKALPDRVKAIIASGLDGL